MPQKNWLLAISLVFAFFANSNKGFINDCFIVLKAYEKTKRKEAPKPAAPKEPSSEDLLTEIRDLLAKK